MLLEPTMPPSSMQPSNSLPDTSALLVQGGDHRIDIAPGSQANKYGCQPFPASDRMAFASSTASTISAQAFEAADRLRNRLVAALNDRSSPSAAELYREELTRVRGELLDICGLASAGTDAIFAASGTDAHLLASHLIAAQCQRQGRALRVIMVNPEESGSGVSTALGDPQDIAGNVMHIALRESDGAPRTQEAIAADADALSRSALQAGSDVLLVLIDVSKTGSVAPDPQFARQLRLRWPGRMHVLVDACQFRIETATLRAYLQQDFMVAVTGSKFIGGPSFSAALLIPPTIAALMRPSGVPAQLAQHCAQEEWPAAWNAEATLPSAANFGLLLRWQAALCELQALRAVPGKLIREFLLAFNAAVQSRLQSDSHFAALPSPALPSRSIGLTPEWDDVPSIHAFTLHRRSAQMSGAETTDVYRRLQQTRHSDGYFYSVGQPVGCGWRDGVEFSALRLCVSAGMIVQACVEQTSGGKVDASTAINGAMACLDAIAALMRSPSHHTHHMQR
jgi:selenocysteine lyase/cysteine desulfurase